MFSGPLDPNPKMTSCPWSWCRNVTSENGVKLSTVHLVCETQTTLYNYCKMDFGVVVPTGGKNGDGVS